MNKKWWEAASVRAIKTFFQTAVGVAAFQAAGTVAGFADIDWIAVLSCSAVSALLSIMTSLAGIPEVEESLHQLEQKGAEDEQQPNG